jgi:hypothetical protein
MHWSDFGSSGTEFCCKNRTLERTPAQCQDVHGVARFFIAIIEKMSTVWHHSQDVHGVARFFIAIKENGQKTNESIFVRLIRSIVYGGKHSVRMDDTRSQSYDFGIYNYNASAVVG